MRRLDERKAALLRHRFDNVEQLRRHLHVVDGSTLLFYRDPTLVDSSVGAAMDPPFPTIARSADIDDAFDIQLGGAPAVVITERERPVGMITKLDLLEFVAQESRMRHKHR